MKRSLFFVSFSLVLTLGFYWTLTCFEKHAPPKIPVKAIAQTGPLKEGLKIDVLAEILQLSSDEPRLIESKEAKEILLKMPFLKTAEVSLLNSGTLYIDYTLRRPLLTLSDFENAAIDEEGILFPLSPYFTPKRLPELFLGLDRALPWGTEFNSPKFHLTRRLIQLLKEEVIRIDISKIEEGSLGKREIVVLLDKGENIHYLRLTPSHYEKQLEYYQLLFSNLEKKDLIIDLRLPHLAYIRTCSKSLR